jgi:hypothetical protein
MSASPPMRKGPARGPGATALQAGPLRGPDPLRQGHRAAEPAAEQLHPEPAVVRDCRTGLRTDRMDTAARPDRDGPPVGTQAPAASPVLSRRPPGQQRTPAAAPARRTLALGQRDHRRSHPPAVHPPRLNSRNSRNSPDGQEGEPPGPVEPRPPGATAGHHSTATR